MVDDEVYARLGAGYRFVSSLELDASFDVATGADDVFGAFNRNYAELRGGVAYDLTPSLRLFGAAGAGVAEGFGTPDWRALMGLRLGSASRRAPAPAPERPAPPCRRPTPTATAILDVADRCPKRGREPQRVRGRRRVPRRSGSRSRQRARRGRSVPRSGRGRRWLPGHQRLPGSRQRRRRRARRRRPVPRRRRRAGD